jgi:hypothetical protein
MLAVFLSITSGSVCSPARGDDGSDKHPSIPARRASTSLPRLFFITPGTRIDAAPPSGWTNLVLKAVPRLSSGEIDTIPESGRATATLFHTALLADVRRSTSAPDAFELRRVGIGVCMPQQGHDIVVTSASAEALGVELSTIPRIVLDRTEHEMADGRLVARTPTFALYRAPVELAVDQVHRKVLLNYGLLVDPSTGALTTTVWWVDAEANPRPPAKEMVIVQPSVVFESELDVSANRILGSLPLSWSFALRSLPPGKALAIPPSLQRWTARDPESHEDAQVFEATLRAALPARN